MPPILVWSDDERAALQEIRRACRFQSDADAIRGALFAYARFLELDIPPDVFALAAPAAPRNVADDQADLGCEEHEGFLG
jgi:hypothetical protein